MAWRLSSSLYYSDLEISRQLTFFGLKACENLVQEQKEDEVERHGSAQLWWKKVAELVVPQLVLGPAPLSLSAGCASLNSTLHSLHRLREQEPIDKQVASSPAPPRPAPSPLECLKYSIKG